MSTPVTASEASFAHLTKDAEQATHVLATGIAETNAVVLNFCNALINQTLEAAERLNRLEVTTAKAGAAAKKAKAGAEKEVQKAVAAAAAKAVSAPVKANTKVNPAEAIDVADAGMAQTFAHSVGIMMENSVQEQRQLFAIANAATTQTISSILTINPEVLGIAVRDILNS